MPMGLEKYTTTTTHIDTPHRKQQHTFYYTLYALDL